MQSFSATCRHLVRTRQFQIPLSVLFFVDFPSPVVGFHGYRLFYYTSCFTCRSSWQWVLEPACPDWKQHHWDQVGVPSLLSSFLSFLLLLISFSLLLSFSPSSPPLLLPFFFYPLIFSPFFSSLSHTQHNSHSNRKRPSTWIWICWHANSRQKRARSVDIITVLYYFLAVF